MASTPPSLQHVPPPVRCPPGAPQLSLTRCRPRRPLRGFSEQLREAWAERRAAQRWHKGASVEPPYVEPAAEKGGAGARRALRGGRQPPCSASIGGEVVAVLDDERSRSLQQARRTAQVGPRRRRHRRRRRRHGGPGPLLMQPWNYPNAAAGQPSWSPGPA